MARETRQVCAPSGVLFFTFRPGLEECLSRALGDTGVSPGLSLRLISGFRPPWAESMATDVSRWLRGVAEPFVIANGPPKGDAPSEGDAPSLYTSVMIGVMCKTESRLKEAMRQRPLGEHLERHQALSKCVTSVQECHP